MNLRRLFTFRFRKRIRRHAKSELGVMLENMQGRYQIDDISQNGLSYHYVGDGRSPRSDIFTIQILTQDKSLSLRLNGKNISDRETGATVSSNQMIRRRSIRFKNVTRWQKNEIKKIIREYTV